MRQPDLEAELKHLESLSVAELKAVWRERLGRPPKHISAALLRFRLGYELQARKLGGLSRATQGRLEKLHNAFTANPNWSPLPYRHLGIGTVLTKAWKGKLRQVTVVEDGYEYEGNCYPSLSEVAYIISGTRRSGPAFFGFKALPS
jgi:hypothetical protein